MLLKKLTTDKIAYVTEVMRMAEKQIKVHTGHELKLMVTDYVVPEINHISLYETLLEHLCMTDEDIKGRNKQRSYTEARVICSMIIKKHYPELSLSQIGAIVGKDHSTIVYHLQNGEVWLETNESFKKKYNSVLHRVNLWISVQLR
jgi:chromosomal replication initiation ATPase DnaA